VPGIDRIEQAADSPAISGLTAYAAAGNESGAIRLLIEVGASDFDIGLDGSTPYRLPAQGACDAYGDITVTADEQWAACTNASGIEMLRLVPQPPADGGLTIPRADTDFPTWPSWSPDGRYLAVLNNMAGGCAIALYAGAPPYTSLQLALLLALPEFATHSTPTECLVRGLRWSPDGAWFVFDGGDLGHKLYGLDARPLLAQLGARPLGSGPLTIPITADRLIPLLDTGFWFPYAWVPGGHVLTLTTAGATLVELDVQTRASRRLLALPLQRGHLCALSWTPDGRHLAFVVCGTQTPDYVAPPSQVYVFTP
jgi:dipeptidyl aminopeptidase/acylaminoacyl peptidase